MKIKKSLVKKIIFYNIFSIIILSIIFTTLFTLFSNMDIKKNIISRLEDMIETSSTNLDTLIENDLNLMAKIEYSDITQKNLSEKHSNNTELKQVKLDIRNIMDNYLTLNTSFLGSSIYSMNDKIIIQSSLMEIENRITEDAISEMKDKTTFFFVLEYYKDYLFILQKIKCSITNSLNYGNDIGYMIVAINNNTYIDSVTIPNALFKSETNIYYNNSLLLSSPPLTESSTCYSKMMNDDFKIEIKIPKDLIIYNPLKSINYIFILLSIAIIVVILSIVVNNSLTRPIKRLKKYCEKIPYELNNIPDDFNDVNELKEISSKINQIIENINILSNKIIQKEQDIYKIELDKQQLSINMLYSQINSHFLYNTLSNIRGLSLKHGDEEVSEALHLLVKYFRYCSNKETYVTLESEIDFLNIYLTIQTMRFGKENFTFNINADCTDKNIKILRMIVQPIVENCFTHGFIEKRNDCKINIIFTTDNDFITIIIKDNGKGFDENILEKINSSNCELPNTKVKSGIGINNIKKRLKLFYKNYSLHAENNVEETTMTITIPIQEETNDTCNYCG